MAGEAEGHWQTGPGSIAMDHVTLRTCVQWAYDVRAYLVSAPEWFDSERFDIAASNWSSSRERSGSATRAAQPPYWPPNRTTSEIRRLRGSPGASGTSGF